MTKITINIENLTLNLSGAAAQRTSAPSDVVANLIKDAISRINEKLDGEEKKTGDSTVGEASRDVTAVIAKEIVEFIKSGEGGRRTGQEITDHFNLPGVIAALLMHSLEGVGDVVSYTENEGEDGEATYFTASVGEEAAGPVTETVDQHDGAAAATHIAVTEDAVLAFLRSDPRYTLRTLDSIAKHFGVERGTDQFDALDGALSHMVDEGKLVAKRRRSDGATLYKAVAPAPVQEVTTQAASATELTRGNVLAFLRSDPRYTMRSLEAIKNHFPGSYDVHEVTGVVYDLEGDGLVNVQHRRSDGETLYSAA